MTAARMLADWVAGLDWSDVPPDQRALTGMRVLDTVGLILAGSRVPAARMAHDMVARQGGDPETAIMPWGTRAPRSWAAFAHGIMAHCRDFDDTFQDSVVHPGSVVIPTTLAVGQATGAAAPDMAAAVAAGYEVAARLGAAAGRGFHLRGLHATGIVGPFAAAATAGRLMELDGERIASAFGLAGSMSGGLMVFLEDGSWSKWVHPGWAAHGGIIAAGLAAEGFRGPAGVFDARFNIYDALLAGDPVDRSALTGSLGHEWRGAEAHFKYYPGAHVIHPYLDAAITIAEAEDLSAREVATVDCRIAPWAVQVVAEPRERKIRPATEMAAISSLPFLVAAALRDRRVTLATLERTAREDPELLDLAARITHSADPALGDGFDGVFSVTFRNGRSIEHRAVSPPPDRDKLAAKFRANAALAAGNDDIDALERAIMGSALPDFGALYKLAGKRRPS